MNTKSFIKGSRTEWWPGYDRLNLSLEEIQTGCLQRIAASLEKIAVPHAQMIEDNKNFRARIEYLRGIQAKQERQIAGLRGALTRARRHPRLDIGR